MCFSEMMILILYFSTSNGIIHRLGGFDFEGLVECFVDCCDSDSFDVGYDLEVIQTPHTGSCLR